MKNIKLTFAVLLLGATTLSSCSQRLIDFTVISSKNVALRIDKSQGKAVKARSMGVFGFGISIKDAMDKALQSAGPDYDLLIDGVVRSKVYPFYAGYIVEGTAVSTSKLKAELGEAGFREWSKNHNILNTNNTEAVNN
jgi:hypothetical protein